MRETFIIVAVIHIAAFAIAFLKTGRGIYLLALGGFILTALAIFAVDHFIDTEKELVERTLYELGDAMVEGDLNVVKGFIGPEHEKGRNDASRALGQIDFSDFKIKSLDVEVNDLTSPKSATAEFFCVISGSDKRGGIAVSHGALNFTVELEKFGERWLVVGHEYSPYRMGN